MEYLRIISTSILFTIIFFLILVKSKPIIKPKFGSTPSNLPKSYPIIGSLFSILKNKERYVQWTSEIVTSTPTLTFLLRLPFGRRSLLTANAANVQYILKTNFLNYEKGVFMKSNLKDLLGDGIFNSDGENWKFQRQISSYEFSTNSLRKFVGTIVDTELSDRLIPFMQKAAAEENVIDFQDILQRFSLDNICMITFGYDPAYLSPSLPSEKFAMAFDDAVRLSGERYRSVSPIWCKIKKVVNVGSEKQLRTAVKEVRDFAREIVMMKKKKPENLSDDLLSRFLNSCHSDEDFLIDIVISFIIAGRDTTSAALTWFFWLLSNHLEVENRILKEIEAKKAAESGYDEVKEMVYTHASLCESMRLYPPIPTDTKEAMNDDVLPDGTVVKKGLRISYHSYAMGRVEKVWGEDWAEFRPSRWLEAAEGGEKLSFVNRDSYTYPVFQAGPRICLGKEMAFLQMKRVVAAVLPRFKVVPAVDGAQPMYISDLTAKMKGGFPVKVKMRI